MKQLTFIAMAGLGRMLILTTACSSNKVSETSSVESSKDGKGTAPPAATAKQADKALVRFVNGTADSKNLVFVDSTPFDGVGSHDITAYKELPAERHDFKLFRKDENTTPVASDSEGLDAGKHYTVLAVTEKNGKTTIDNIADDLTPPPLGMAKVRVINLAPAMKKSICMPEERRIPSSVVQAWTTRRTTRTYPHQRLRFTSGIQLTRETQFPLTTST